MSGTKLIHYYSSHPAACRFWASSPLDNMTLNPANEKTDQSFFFFFFDIQTGIGAYVHATLDT